MQNTKSFILVSGGLMLVSSVFFILDVMADLSEHLAAGVSYSAVEMVHLVFEITAVLALILGIVQMVMHLRGLERLSVSQAASLHHLRQDFDALIRQKFSDWGLSKTEADIGLLIVRGLNNEEIAKVRGVKLGTIKSQTHSLMVKAGVKSRVELLSVFVDEFIDIGTNTD